VVYTVKKSKIAVIIYDDNTRETFGNDNGTKYDDEEYYDEDTRETSSGYNKITYDDYERNTFSTRNGSIEGSIGYIRAVIDGLDDYPLGGLGFNFGTSAFIPSSAAAKFGIGAFFNFFTASAKDEYNAELTLSGMSLSLTPTIRFGKDKTYADIGLEISIPFFYEVTLKAPGYGSQTQKNDDAESAFALTFSGRLDVIGFGIGKILTGNDKALVLGAFSFIPAGEQFEIVPSITYSIGDVASQLNLFIGFNRWF